MDLKIKAMTILAIFCLLISAGSACAAEDIATNSDDEIPMTYSVLIWIIM